MEFVKVFLLTYHAFTTPREILDQLMKRYVFFSSDAKSTEKWKAERLRYFFYSSFSKSQYW